MESHLDDALHVLQGHAVNRFTDLSTQPSSTVSPTNGRSLNNNPHSICVGSDGQSPLSLNSQMVRSRYVISLLVLF